MDKPDRSTEQDHLQPDPSRDRRHLAATIEQAGTPPIIIGHSFGGTLAQLLLARGLAAAGVVIDSAPTEGVRVDPLPQAKSLLPALKNPANGHRPAGFTPDEVHYAFTNTQLATMGLEPPAGVPIEVAGPSAVAERWLRHRGHRSGASSGRGLSSRLEAVGSEKHDVLDDAPDVELVTDFEHAWHRQALAYAVVGVSGHGRDVVREQDAPFGGCPLEDGRIVGAAEFRVLDAEVVDGRRRPKGLAWWTTQ